MLHVVNCWHVRVRVGSGGANVGAHASDGDAGGEVVEQVALQALRRLVVGMVVVRGQHRRVMEVPRRWCGSAGHARHGGHGVVGGIWLERMTLLSHVDRRQRLGSLEKGLVEAGEDVTLQLRDREQALVSVANYYFFFTTKT